MNNKIHLRTTNGLQKGERRLRRKEIRFIQSLYPWMEMNAMRVVRLRLSRSSLKAVLRCS